MINKEKKILIVSPYFAPENSIASIRFTKISKYLSRHGYDVSVLCTQVETNCVIDETLKRDLTEIKNVKRIRYPEILYYRIKDIFGAERKKKKNNKKNNAEIVKVGQINLLYNNFCNVILGIKYINYIKRNKTKYDIVVSTYSPIAGHILGRYMKKRGLCSKWIADFRDPFSTLEDSSFANKLLQFQGVKIVNLADCVTVASKGTAKKLCMEAKEFGVDLKDKVKIIYNGFDTDDRKIIDESNSTQDELTITYCGSLYVIDGVLKSDVSILFAALAELIENRTLDKFRIKINYAGKDGALFVDLAKKYGLEEIVNNHGYISRDESVLLQKNSDIVVVAVWNEKGNTGVISGKFFETLLVKKNALCIITGNIHGSELKSIVEDINCGHVCEVIENDNSELPEMKKWIIEKYKEKCENGKLNYCGNNKELKYSYELLTKKMEKCFDFEKRKK